MGVPHFFKYLIDNYPDILVSKNSIETIDHLFFDLNCLIHPCANKVIKKCIEQNNQLGIVDKIIKEVQNYLQFLIEYANPVKTLYIAIDGPAPRAKMQQQRTRRFKNAKINRISSKIRKDLDMEEQITWDTNAITPGTEFMDTLNKNLKSFLSKLKLKCNVVLSNSNVPGEGEHKIMDYIRNAKLSSDDTFVIYGLDADLIFLSMITKMPNMYLLRERVYFGRNKKGSPDMDKKSYKEIEYDFMSIKMLKYYFYEESKLKTKEEYDIDHLIQDFIFLCFFIGNDFLPNLCSVDIKYGGLDKIQSYYYDIMPKMEQYLITEKGINETFLFELLKVLSDNETLTFKENYKKRIESHFNPNYNFKNGLTEVENKYNSKLNDFNIVYRKERDIIQLGRYGYNDRYYKHYFNVDISNDSEYQNIKNNICKEYLIGLNWVYQYYFTGQKNYTWFYPYIKTPFASDLVAYISNGNSSIIKIPKSDAPRPLYQLLMVLPPDSSRLMPPELQQLMINSKSKIIEYYPLDFKTDMINHKFYYECAPYLPIIDSQKVLEVYQECKLSPAIQKRNTYQKEIIIK